MADIKHLAFRLKECGFESLVTDSMLIDKTMSTMNHHLENIKLYLSTKGYTSFEDFVMDLRTSLEEHSLTLANAIQVPGMLQPPAEANMTTQQPRNNPLLPTHFHTSRQLVPSRGGSMALSFRC